MALICVRRTPSAEVCRRGAAGAFALCLAATWLAIQATPAAASATELNDRGVIEARAGRFPEGIELLRQALALDPEDATVRANLSGVLTDWAGRLDQQGRTDHALAALQEAVSLQAGNGMAWAALGDLRYARRSDLAGAIEAWERAHGQVPEALRRPLADRITQARRDQLIERGFAVRKTARADIRFERAHDADVEPLARALDEGHARLSQALGGGPSRVSVIIYTQADLRRVYNQRDWAMGLYDGRIRLVVDDLTREALPDLVLHELAHAFLHDRYPRGLPIWVHEGYAQLQERERALAPEAARIEQGLRERTGWVPLTWLDRHFEQPSGAEDIARAYLEARFVVRKLVARFGTERWAQFLSQLSAGTPVEAAYDQAFAPSRWVRASQGNFE